MTTDVRVLFSPDKMWREKALCATPENKKRYFKERDIWFPPETDDPDYDESRVSEDIALAKSICISCPVRDLCLREALEDKDGIHGNRGGLSETEIRKTLSVDETGKEIRRGEFPECPYCHAPTESLNPTTIDLPDGGRWAVAKAVKCANCGFEWKSRSSHNAVTAFFEDRRKRTEQERREQIARERLSK